MEASVWRPNGDADHPDLAERADEGNTFGEAWCRVPTDDAEDADHAEDAETATATDGSGILGVQGRREELLMKRMKGA